MSGKQLTFEAFSRTLLPPVLPPPRKHGPAGTRQAAREAIHPHLTRLAAIVLGAIRQAGEAGRTDAEIEVLTGLRADTARARRVALVRGGFVRDSGRRRQTASGRWATVWVSTIPPTSHKDLVSYCHCIDLAPCVIDSWWSQVAVG